MFRYASTVCLVLLLRLFGFLVKLAIVGALVYYMITALFKGTL